MSGEHQYEPDCMCAPCYLERESRIRQSLFAGPTKGSKVNKFEETPAEAPGGRLLPEAPGLAIEYCWKCGGYGQSQCLQTPQHPTGYEKCWECKGTGYGESLQTYRKRHGITLNDEREDQHGQLQEGVPHFDDQESPA